MLALGLGRGVFFWVEGDLGVLGGKRAKRPAEAGEANGWEFLEGEERTGRTLEFEPERSGDSRGQT